MHYWNLLWDWNTLDSVRAVHSFLEGWALVFFGLLVLFDVLAHFAEESKSRAKHLERIGLACFALAVLSEALAYPYSRRNDALARRQDAEQQAKIAALDNATQGLKTDAQNARTQAEGFKAQIAASGALAKHAEAQVASAKADSAAASAKAEGFRLEIAKAQESAAKATEEAARITKDNLVLQADILRLQGNIADRVLTSDQRSKFISVLAGTSKFPISFTSLDGEPARYARQIISALTGWKINAEGVGITTLRLDPGLEASIQANVPGGVPIIHFGPNANHANVRVLEQAFVAAGIKAVAVEFAKDTTDEIAIHVPLKIPQ